MPDDKKEAPKLPMPMPSMPKPGGATAGPKPLPPMGGLPPLAPHPGLKGPESPLGQRPSPPAPPDAALQRKLADTEKRLFDEREKVMAVSIQQQQEKIYAAKVEEAIRDVQEKLRRDRRDAEMEETRLDLQTRIQDLENKLVTEREAWVSTLKNQVQQRESQDRQVEAHFTSRMQEMERRWLEEKAHWQKVILAKDEELRNLQLQCEKLKNADAQLDKAQSERNLFERRANELSQDLAKAEAQLEQAAEHERQFFEQKAELTVAREQARMLQDKLERELQSVRIQSKEREERVLADNERLQRDIQAISQRVRAEAEIEVRKHKSQADLAGAGLQRMRAVGQALERQVAALRMQAEEASTMKKEMQTLNERYKAEFIVLQRRWQEREKEVRSEAQAAAQKELLAAKQSLAHDLDAGKKEFEAEKARIRLRAQDEVQARVEKAEDQLKRQLEETLKHKEALIRRELEHDLETRAARLQDKLKTEVETLRGELAAKEAVERDRMLAKEGELASLRTALDELRGHLANEQEWRKTVSAEKDLVEREAIARQDAVRRANEAAEEMKGRLAKEEEWKRVLLQEKANLEKLVVSLEAELRHKHVAGANPQAPEPPSSGLLGRLFPGKPPEPPRPPL